MLGLDTILSIPGVRFPRIFNWQGTMYLTGSTLAAQQGDICKYLARMWRLDSKCNPCGDGHLVVSNELEPYLDDLNYSSWVRDVTVVDDKLVMLYEIKLNVDNTHYYNHNYSLSSADGLNYETIETYKRHDFMFKIIDLPGKHISIESRIEYDPEFFWGKYLFAIYVNGELLAPEFVGMPDADNDEGHFMHGILPDTDGFRVLMSVRRKEHGKQRYFVYTAHTTDFVKYSNIREVLPPPGIAGMSWISYPCWFMRDNKLCLICNGDDFGKHTPPHIFEHSMDVNVPDGS